MHNKFEEFYTGSTNKKSSLSIIFKVVVVKSQHTIYDKLY